MEVEFLCSDCNRANQLELTDSHSEPSCAACGKKYGPVLEFIDEDSRVQHCGICGCRDLYVQKDFNRVLGCTIVLIGAILAPFTKFISLFACALMDLLLYRFLPQITICYRCKSIYRDFTRNPAHEAFNLGIHDRYRSVERG